MQEEVEKALRRLHWKDKRILAAGRTDTGVHATGQVIVFDLDWNHTELELRQAINAYLPMDIVAREVRRVNARFDPRRHAESRCYQYRIFFEELRNPMRERYAWRVWPAADIDLLEQACRMLIGEHDFRAFGTPPRAGGSTIRKIEKTGWKLRSDELQFEVIGNAFLYHMVRRMVTLQIAIGQGKMNILELPTYLDPITPEIYVQGLAPAQGLCLTEVKYPKEKLAID